MLRIENHAHTKRSPKLKTFLSVNNDLVHLVYRLRKEATAKGIAKLYPALQNFEERSKDNKPQWPNIKPLLSPARRALDVNELALEYKAGRSLRQLAAKYGIDRKTVALQLRKVGVPLRSPGCNVAGEVVPVTPIV